MVRRYHGDFLGLSHLVPKMEIPKSDLTLCVVCLIAGVALIFIGGITIEEKIQITLQMDPGASVLNHALPCIQGMVSVNKYWRFSKQYIVCSCVMELILCPGSSSMAE